MKKKLKKKKKLEKKENNDNDKNSFIVSFIFVFNEIYAIYVIMTFII